MQSVKQTCVAFLITTLLAPGLFLGITPPKQAEAQVADIIGNIAGAGVQYALCEYGEDIREFLGGMLGGVLGDIFGFGENENPNSNEATYDAIPVTETNTQLKQNVGKTRTTVELNTYKECVLDPVAWVIKALLINVVEQDILDWIDNGFEGGPVFLRDPLAFAKALARDAFDEYMEESGVDAFFCSSFQTDMVQRMNHLSTQSTFGNLGSARCTVDDIFDTIAGSGNIETDGIVGAMRIAEEGNNPYSSFFNIQADAAQRTGEIVSREMTLANYGDGYHSERCLYNGEWGVCTPGQLISRQVDDWMGGSLSQMENADEAGEVVSQLVANLVLHIFGDSQDGLLGGHELEDDDANAIDNEPGYTNPIDGMCTAGLETPPTSIPEVGDAVTLQLHSDQTEDGRSIYYLNNGLGAPSMSTYPPVFQVEVPGCDAFYVINDGCQFDHNGYVVAESQIESRGLVVAIPHRCNAPSEVYLRNTEPTDLSTVVVAYTDPNTQETWVSNGDNGFLNTATGQTIEYVGGGGGDDDDVGGGESGYVDTETGETISLPDNLSIALDVENVDWVATAFTIAHIASYFTNLPSWAVTVAEVGYTVASDWEGFVNSYNSAMMVGAPGTNLSPDETNPGGWVDPDTGETWGGYGSGWTDPDTGETWGPDDVGGWTNPDTGETWGPDDVEGWSNPDTGETWGGGDDDDDGGGDSGGFGCFLAGTNVTMADGTLKPIEQIEAGEHVLSYNQSTNSFEDKEVLILYTHPYEGDYLIINNTLHVTPNHITYINNTWKRIDSANIGDLLLLSTGSYSYIEDIDYSYTDKNVYNLEIADTHTYFAEGFLVHNIK